MLHGSGAEGLARQQAVTSSLPNNSYANFPPPLRVFCFLPTLGDLLRHLKCGERCLDVLRLVVSDLGLALVLPGNLCGRPSFFTPR